MTRTRFHFPHLENVVALLDRDRIALGRLYQLQLEVAVDAGHLPALLDQSDESMSCIDQSEASIKCIDQSEVSIITSRGTFLG